MSALTSTRERLPPPNDNIEDERQKRREEAWDPCSALAQQPRILDHLASALKRGGLVGEQRAAKLLYLVLTSRLLDRPICAKITGPSSAGKNYVTGAVLRLFPPSAYYRMTSMSPRLLAYSKEPLVHRILVLEEAAGLGDGIGAYLMRSLISEGHLRHETVANTSDGFTPMVLERDGPTGLLVTTTAVALEPELETRMFTIPVTDTPEHTRDVLAAIGAEAMGQRQTSTVDPGPWHALQERIESSGRVSVVPFADKLAAAIPPVAVRLRRDFGAILRLVQTHAILHQAQRKLDEQGRVIATLDDYAAVFELTADLVASGVGASVPPTVRETVAAVAELTAQQQPRIGVMQSRVRERLGLDKSSVSRRVAAAIKSGFLVNSEERKGRPACLELGEALPDECEVLPRPEALRQPWRCCGGCAGDATPFSRLTS
jgi:hypothetical protein